MGDYELVWRDQKKSINKYKESFEFEQCFLDLAVETTQSSYDVIWEVLSFQKVLEPYQFDSNFENMYLSGQKFRSLEDLWRHVSKWSSCEDYKRTDDLEKEFVDAEFHAAFEYSSNLINVPKYKFCSRFEECLNEIVPTELLLTNDNPDPKKKGIKTKDKKSQKLKNLFDLRLKRLKVMSDHIETVRNDETKTIIYKCKICNFQCLRKRKLYVSHVIPAHISVSKPKAPRRKNRNVSVESVVSKHFYCSDLYCSKKFTTRCARKRHMRFFHRKAQRCSCDSCPKTFRDAHDLSRHKTLQHKVPLGLFKCGLCTYRTKRSHNLERHCEKIHGDKCDFGAGGSLVCQVRQKVFFTGFRLNKHLEVHQAISLGYDCPLCDNKVEENHRCKFKCLKCDRIFVSKVSLHNHAKIHTQIEAVCHNVSKFEGHGRLEEQLSNLKFD